MSETAKEKRFLDALESLFTGAEVEGDSGFVNLMRIKRAYFQSIRGKLTEAIDGRAEKETAFREELFDKLYTFFSRFFCESGSIYFRHLPAFAKTYERVYADGEDVALSWKTRMLYYVKSDVLVRSMPVELRDRDNPEYIRRLYFDASAVEHKRNNEKREFTFEFSEVDATTGRRVLHLNVFHSANGRKTKPDAIIKQARKGGIILSEDELEKAFRVFRRQTEADFFINKDARGFLREQFDLWLYQYVFQEDTIFEQRRLTQLQALQHTAYDVIDFIAQFEDELRRVWEKPKLARAVNYVVTLDKLPADLLKRIIRHEGIAAQITEWQQLGMVEKGFSFSPSPAGRGSSFSPSPSGRGAGVREPWQHLPLDTKYFKDLELEILDALGDLNEALDGELVHSENWQALNTLQKRYKGKVKCIYIDPPYNTGLSEIIYKNSNKHSTWLTLIENRIGFGKNLLSESGIQCTTIDDYEFHRLREIISSTFGEENILGVVVIKNNPSGRSTVKGFSSAHEYAIFSTTSGGKIGRLERTRKQIDRYSESDEHGYFEWVNFRKHGGTRSEAPKMFYPIFVRQNTLRLPEMHWDEGSKDWKLHEKPGVGEVTIYPVDENGKERRWKWAIDRLQKNLEEILIKNGRSKEPAIYIKSRLSGDGVLPLTWWEKKEYSATAYGTNFLKNIMGDLRSFDYPKSIYAVCDAIKVCVSERGGIVFDYFAGSGTTAHAVINLNREDGGKRKYILVEMGDYFHTVLLPRVKKVIYSKDWKDGKPVSREGSSHVLKYYALEQYEETLRRARYEDGEQLEIDSLKSPFEQYVFFSDDKLAHAVKPLQNGTLTINLRDLYPDVDVAESLSNVLGKPIRRRTANDVTFTDDTVEKTNPATMTEPEKQHFIALIKPYLWWGE